MKTATITWITYNNFGTLLQAYALQKYITMLGHENELISDSIILKEFQKKKAASKAAPAGPIKPVSRKERIKNLIVNPRRIGRVITARVNKKKYQSPYYGMQSRCEEFKKSELSIRNGCSADMLQALNGDYDAFICGSDQIWSVFPDIFNPYYYLDFSTKKKIAYAPSLGSDMIPETIGQRIKVLLSDFSEISVRESVSPKQLEALTGNSVEWVCDPTILHDMDFWHTFAKGTEKPKGRYLLCYFLENKPWYFEYAKRIAKARHLKIKLIPNKWDYISSENVLTYAVGPKEFVSLFENANFILTDSYHGSIFSLIFEKDFLYLQRFADDNPCSQNIRVDSLFTYLDIDDIIVDSTMRTRHNESLDYRRISELLRDYREKSRNYLQRCLTS